MLSMALHLRDQEMSLRDIAKRLVITTGAKKGQHPSPATVMAWCNCVAVFAVSRWEGALDRVTAKRS